MKKIYQTPRAVAYTLSSLSPLAASGDPTYTYDPSTQVNEQWTNKKETDNEHPIWGEKGW